MKFDTTEYAKLTQGPAPDLCVSGVSQVHTPDAFAFKMYLQNSNGTASAGTGFLQDCSVQANVCMGSANVDGASRHAVFSGGAMLIAVLFWLAQK
jgi:hypothetical protein